MAKEHRCPNCGFVTMCNSATSKIHVCQRCGHRWEEDLSKVPAAKAP